MNLTTPQLNYLENELLERGRSFIDEYYAEKERFRPTATPEELGLSTDQIEAGKTRQLAKDLIKVRSATFIQVFTDLGKFPDDEDYIAFRESSHALVVNHTMKLFEEACQNFFARPAHEIIAGAIRTTLPNELQKICTDGIKPVTSFFLKGKALEDDMNDTFSQREMAVLQRIYNLTNGKLGVMVEIEKLSAQMDMPGFEMNGFINSMEKKGYIGGLDEVVWIEADGIREIEDEKPDASAPPLNSTIYHIHAPVGAIQNQTQNSSQNVTQAIQITNNPDFDKAIQAISELVKAAEISDEDKSEALSDLATINRLALDPDKPGISARALAKIASLDTLLKVTPIAIKVAEYLPAIKAYFEN